MSRVPLMFHDWWDDFDRPTSQLLFDQYFGGIRDLNRDHLFSSFSNLALTRPRLFGNTLSYYPSWRNLPWRNLASCQGSGSGTSTIQTDNDKFQVILDVQQFSPDEITVKTRDNCVIVEAKHSERQDEHGFVSRHFVRRYILSSTYDVLNVTSSLSSDGVLTITAPQKNLTPGVTERVIDIVKTDVSTEEEELKEDKPSEPKITTEMT